MLLNIIFSYVWEHDINRFPIKNEKTKYLFQESELSKTLFDDDFDLDMNKGPAGVSEAVSDFSELFNNSDTSTLSLLDAKYAQKPPQQQVLDYYWTIFYSFDTDQINANFS